MIDVRNEFKADTSERKYAFVLNNPIHRKCLRIYYQREKKSTYYYNILHIVIIGTQPGMSFQTCTNHIY